MKALVTGATGFIGSHVAERLSELGFDINVIYRKTSNLRWIENKPYKLFEASLFNQDSLKNALDGVDYVFHIAGAVFGRNYDEFLKSNRDATVNLLEATKKYSPNIKRFLYLSSQTVAGPSPSLDKPKTEQDDCNPITSYGKSKLEAEHQVLNYKNILPVSIARPPAVIGPRDTAILTIFQSINKGLGTLIGFNPKYISLIHSKDLSRGIVETALSDNTLGEVYFVSSEQFYTWDLLLDTMAKSANKRIFKLKIPHSIVLSAAWTTEMVGKLLPKPPVFNYEKGIDFIQNYWTCSVDKAKKDFGWKQKMSVEEMIDDTMKWYRDNKWL